MPACLVDKTRDRWVYFTPSGIKTCNTLIPEILFVFAYTQRQFFFWKKRNPKKFLVLVFFNDYYLRDTQSKFIVGIDRRPFPDKPEFIDEPERKYRART